MSIIDDEMSKAITKHLPQMVGDELQERLKQANNERKELKAALDTLSRHEKLMAIQKALDQQKGEIDITIAELKDATEQLDGRVVALQIKEATIQIRENHAEQMIHMMRDTVKDVFSNNRYKYERTTTKEGENVVAVHGGDNVCGWIDRTPIDHTETVTEKGES